MAVVNHGGVTHFRKRENLRSSKSGKSRFLSPVIEVTSVRSLPESSECIFTWKEGDKCEDEKPSGKLFDYDQRGGMGKSVRNLAESFGCIQTVESWLVSSLSFLM